MRVMRVASRGCQRRNREPLTGIQRTDVSIVVMLCRRRRRCVVMDVSESSAVMGAVAIVGAVLGTVLVACPTISMVEMVISMVEMVVCHVHVGIGVCMLAPAAALGTGLGVYLGVYLGQIEATHVDEHASRELASHARYHIRAPVDRADPEPHLMREAISGHQWSSGTAEAAIESHT